MRFTIATMLSLAAASSAAMTAQQVTSNIDAITQLSSEANNNAKSISVVNFFQTGPRLINNFRGIVQTVQQDITSMNAKRSLQARQECLDVTDVQQCINDLGEIIEDPAEVLGKKKRDEEASKLIPGILKRQECLNVEDPEQCIADLGEIIEDPSEVLGEKKKREEEASELIPGLFDKRTNKKARQAAAYTGAEQQGICNAFRIFVQVHQELLNTVIGKHGVLSLTPFTQPIAAVLRALEGGFDTIAFGIIDTVPTCAESAMQNKNSLDNTLQEAENTYAN